MTGIELAQSGLEGRFLTIEETPAESPHSDSNRDASRTKARCCRRTPGGRDGAVGGSRTRGLPHTKGVLGHLSFDGMEPSTGIEPASSAVRKRCSSRLSFEGEVERMMGFEPTTSGMAHRRSTC